MAHHDDAKKVEEAEHLRKALEARNEFSATFHVSASQWRGDNEWQKNPNAKLVHFVRHGQGYHNLLANVARQCGATFSGAGEYEAAIRDSSPYIHPALVDPPLTSLGIQDAKNLRANFSQLQPNLYVVSPMKRATETILIGFKDHIKTGITVIAHEDCREQTGVHTCDMRSSLSDYKDCYNVVNCDLLVSEEDPLWEERQRESMATVAARAEQFLKWLLLERQETEVVVGTHSAWLIALLNIVLVDIQDCDVSMFTTGELRSVVLCWKDATG
jgi:broad specificity phosphatase PhoE